MASHPGSGRPLGEDSELKIARQREKQLEERLEEKLFILFGDKISTIFFVFLFLCHTLYGFDFQSLLVARSFYLKLPTQSSHL